MTRQLQTQDDVYTTDESASSTHSRILKISQTAIVTLNSNLEVLNIAGATEALFERDIDTLTGQAYTSLIAPGHQKTILEKLQTSGIQVLDYPVVKANGDIQWVHHRGENNDSTVEFIIHPAPEPQTASPQKSSGKVASQQTLIDAFPDMLLVVNNDSIVTEFHSSPDAKTLDIDDSITGKPVGETNLPEPLIDETRLFLDIDLKNYVQSIEFAQDEADTGSEYFEARLVRLDANEIMIIIRNVTSMKRVQDELSRHIEDLHLVRQVNVELAADLDVNYVSYLALDSALRLTNAQAGYLAMRQQTGNFVLMSQFGTYDPQKIELQLTNLDGIVGRALSNRRPELILNVHDDDDYAPILDDTHAMIVIPLLSKEAIVGILVLEARTDDRFSHERFQFLQLITGRIAAFLDNAMLHRQKEEQYQEVVQLEQLKTDMIRIANHDLKNPIAGIMGYMELLRFDINDKLTEREQSYLDKIEVAAKKMQRITTGILSLERIQQLSEQQMLKTINLNKLVSQSVSEQMDYAVRSEQKLHRTLPEDDIFVQGDPLQLHEALSNLISNAIKYTPKHGTVQVTLATTATKAKVTVVDTGYGIPDDQKERLFAPFYRVKTRETRFIEGSGLGLHLVKNIIERHSGEMFFESDYGKGSTFGFTIPLKISSLDDDDEQSQ